MRLFNEFALTTSDEANMGHLKMSFALFLFPRMGMATSSLNTW